MIDSSTLEKAGLTPIEAKIYLTLLELGPSLAGQIAKRSGFHRRSVYDVLDRLAEKGLVSYIVKNNRRLYSSVNPQRLLSFIKEKEDEIKKAIPELQSYYHLVREKEEINFYKGREGVKTAFEDQISTGKPILIWGASTSATEILKYYFEWFDRRRKEKKIRVKIIFDETARKKHHKIPLSEIRYLPKEFSSPAATNIYGDKVSIVLWSREKPFAIVIKNKEITDSYRKYFELMWKVARK